MVKRNANKRLPERAVFLLHIKIVYNEVMMNNDCKCGNKPKSNRCYPSAVVSIENPDKIVLFHRVDIPVSLGDERQTPPTIGKYCNVLMVYEVNGHAYLYSSDGIPTKLTLESESIKVVPLTPDVKDATPNVLYITESGSAYITTDNVTWIKIAGGGSGGTDDFNDLINRPKVDGQPMTSATDIPLSSLTSQINSLSSSLSSLARVAYTGEYSDLENEPIEYTTAEWNALWA